VVNLTGNFHHIARNDLPGLDHLHALPVRPVNLPHLRLVLLQSLDGALCIAILLQTYTQSKTSNICIAVNCTLKVADCVTDGCHNGNYSFIARCS